MSFRRYPAYKDSGVKWLGEMPEHWAVKRLRFVVELNPSKSEISSLDRLTPISFLPMDAIGDDGSLRIDEEKQIGEVETGYTYFRDGDVTIAKITPCYENGKGAIMRGLINGIGFGTTELIVTRPNPSETIPAYLHYLFVSPDFRGIGESHMYGAGGQKRVPDEFVKNFKTAMPPLPEQNRIAAFLDRETAKIDELAAEQQRLIDLLKEKRQAVISHAVTKGLNPVAPMKPSGIEWLGDVPAHWEVKRLKYLGSAITGLTYDPANIVNEGEGTLVLRSSNVQNGKITYDDNVYVSTAIPEELVTRRGDILICSRNGSRVLIGKNALIDGEAIGVTYGAFMTVLRSVHCDYLHCVLNSPVFEFQSSAFMTSTINQLTIGILNNMEIPWPPEFERRVIGLHVREWTLRLDTLTTEAQRAIDLLQERRTALISAAVTGQIDVRHLAEATAA